MKYICHNCKHEFWDDEAVSKCVFAGNREEPAEYELHCPDCNAGEDSMSQMITCRDCGVNYPDCDTHKCEPIKLTLEEQSNRDCDNAIKSAKYMADYFNEIFGGIK